MYYIVSTSNNSFVCYCTPVIETLLAVEVCATMTNINMLPNYRAVPLQENMQPKIQNIISVYIVYYTLLCHSEETL